MSSLSSALTSSVKDHPPLETGSDTNHGIPDLREVNSSNYMSGPDRISTLSHEHLDLDVSIFGEDGSSPFGSPSTFDDAHDFSSCSFSQFDISQASPGPGDLWHAAHDTNAQELESNFGERPEWSSIRMLGTKSPDGTDAPSLYKNSEEYQWSVEQLSKLSMEVYRQLGLSGTAVDLVLASELGSSSHREGEPQHPIAMMIHGLQKFQELLQVVLSSSSRLCAGMARNNPASLGSAFPPTEIPMQHKRSDGTHLTAEGRSCDSPLAPSVNTRPSYRNSSSTEPLPISHNQVSQGQIHQLDLPTSLVIITCYINLVRLCRNVFSNIRTCLVTLDRRAVFTSLSDLQIGGVSLQQDGNLQILVLVQVVIRLLDRIGNSLCFPNRISIGGAKRTEEPLWNKMIAPKLMDFVLREEELDGQGQYGGGIRALREEIRKLKRVLNKL